MTYRIDALLPLLLILALLPPRPAHAQSGKTETLSRADSLSFTDISVSSGVAATGSPRLGGHAALFSDVNDDDLPDLFITVLLEGTPLSDLFFLNRGAGEFDEAAAARGIADFDGGSHGAAFGDLDNDGDFDLLNGTTLGYDQTTAVNNIFRNDGSGFFTDFTEESGIAQRDWPTRGVVTFDMDEDGDLDIFCVTNFAGSNDPPGERNEVYRNNGDMTFTAINFGDLFEAPAGQGATDTDFDDDGDIDIIAGNRWGDLNILRNDGFGNFTLTPPEDLGINHRGREGVTMGDVDNDGDLDMLLSDWDFDEEIAIEHLYFNDGDGTFTYQRTFRETRGYMGGFADLDHDGDLDLIFSGDDKCYLNDGDGNFSVGPEVPVSGTDSPRAIAFADIDNDGDLDFAIGVKRSRNWLVRNDFNGGNWLKVKLVSPYGQAGAFGARVSVFPAGQIGEGLLGLREARSNNGYLSQNQPVLHFGLAGHTVVDVVVRFLDETTFVETGVAANQTLTIDASVTGPQVPLITSFEPESAQVGETIRFGGSNFTTVNGIRFNGVTAPQYTLLGDNLIEVEVPEDATSGFVRARNDKGVGTSNAPFIVVYQPEIESFTPTVATVGMEVTVKGAHFDEVDEFLFNGVESNDVTVDYASRVRAIVPEGASSGPITISNSAGSATSSDILNLVPETIGVTSPNGGEVFTPATEQTITWSAVGVFDRVDIDFSADNGGSWLAIAENTDNDGSFVWLIPDLDADSCLVRVTKSGDPDVFDVSDAPFKIDSATLQLETPNGGEQWPVGSIQNVKWTSTGDIDSVKLRFSGDGGESFETFAIVENSGRFGWRLPDYVSDSCLVRIVDHADNFPGDDSDALFRIYRAPIVVTAPNGGETWPAGSMQSITWLTDGTADSVQLELSTDQGRSWGSIDRVADDGDYVYAVPNVVSDSCLIRISANQAEDISDDVFTIDIVDDIGDAPGPIPSDYELFANYPNPFNLETKIKFALPESGRARLVIYNIAGARIRALVQGRYTAGQHVVSWDGRDDLGRGVSSGVYVYRLTSGSFTQSRKMLLIK